MRLKYIFIIILRFLLLYNSFQSLQFVFHLIWIFGLVLVSPLVRQPWTFSKINDYQQVGINLWYQVQGTMVAHNLIHFNRTLQEKCKKQQKKIWGGTFHLQPNSGIYEKCKVLLKIYLIYQWEFYFFTWQVSRMRRLDVWLMKCWLQP